MSQNITYPSRELALSKLYRLKLAGEIRRLILSLHTMYLEEIHHGDHIYCARGYFKVGSEFRFGKIRIGLKGENISVLVKIDFASIKIVYPFNNEEERARAPERINRVIRNCLN
jgi:hypothetical protein